MTFIYKEQHLQSKAFGTVSYSLVSYAQILIKQFLFLSVQGYAFTHQLPLLASVTVLGIASQPTSVTVNGQPMSFNSTTIGDTTEMTVTLKNTPMGTNFDLHWV